MPIPFTFLPTVATVDLAALAHNLLQLRRVLSPGCDIMAVVKANAYGHGAVEIARTLTRHGVVRLAVFSIEEGISSVKQVSQSRSLFLDRSFESNLKTSLRISLRR